MMKIPLASLTPIFKMTMEGSEPWLEELYQNFSGCKSPNSRLVGSFKLELEMAGTVKAEGTFSYTPRIGCGRCDKTVDWPQDLSFNTRFYEPLPAEDLPKDHELTQGELDSYYIENGFIDILTLITDTVNADIPNHPILLTEDGEHCRICLDAVGSENYEDPAGKELSPFAALKNLKTRN